MVNIRVSPKVEVKTNQNVEPSLPHADIASVTSLLIATNRRLTLSGLVKAADRQRPRGMQLCCAKRVDVRAGRLGLAGGDCRTFFNIRAPSTVDLQLAHALHCRCEPFRAGRGQPYTRDVGGREQA